jgi:hypothetical protein
LSRKMFSIRSKCIGVACTAPKNVSSPFLRMKQPTNVQIRVAQRFIVTNRQLSPHGMVVPCQASTSRGPQVFVWSYCTSYCTKVL